MNHIGKSLHKFFEKRFHMSFLIFLGASAQAISIRRASLTIYFIREFLLSNVFKSVTSVVHGYTFL
jgi:hypothetical protein